MNEERTTLGRQTPADMEKTDGNDSAVSAQLFSYLQASFPPVSKHLDGQRDLAGTMQMKEGREPNQPFQQCNSFDTPL